MAKKAVTTSLVLTDEQHRLLKQVAALRMVRGQMQTASVSEVIRQLIEQHETDFRKELGGFNET